MPWLAVVAFVSAAVPAAATADAAPQAVERRIQALRDALKIAPSQASQWNRFTAAMHGNATAADALFRNRAGSLSASGAADTLKSYADVARAYADDMQMLSQAFQPLYGSLSEPQRLTADALFRQPASR